jgi:hypothetical protein
MSTTAPIPPRFWWLKRLTAGGIALFFLMLALRLWWGDVAQRRLDAEISAAQSRGEPALIVDFADASADHPSDVQNAAAQYTAAGAAINYNAAQSAFDNRFNSDTALSDADRKMLDGLVAANARTISLCRIAADLPRASWGLKLHSPVVNVMLPALNWQRGLANMLVYAEIDHHLHGDDALAVEDLRDIFCEADAVEHYGPFIITHLVAIGINALGADRVARLAGNLKIGPDGASVAAVQRLIAQIIDEREYRAAGERCWYGERLIAIDANGTLGFTLPQVRDNLLWPVQPMLTLDQIRVFQYDTAVAHAMREPTLSTASTKLPPLPLKGTFSPLYTAAHIYTLFVMASVNRSVLTHYRGLTERRAAAVLLAIRLYQVDHGAAPANLDLLVPAYLPAVPLDPFSKDRHPLRYIATPGSEAVYSVGEDAHDDGGSTQLRRAISGRTPGPWDMIDAVFPFHPAPLLPPATEPANEN